MDPVLENAVLKFSKFVGIAYTELLKLRSVEMKLRKVLSKSASGSKQNEQDAMQFTELLKFQSLHFCCEIL